MSAKHRAVPVKKIQVSRKRRKALTLFMGGFMTVLGHDTQAFLAGEPSTLGRLAETAFSFLECLPW